MNIKKVSFFIVITLFFNQYVNPSSTTLSTTARKATLRTSPVVRGRISSRLAAPTGSALSSRTFQPSTPTTQPKRTFSSSAFSSPPYKQQQPESPARSTLRARPLSSTATAAPTSNELALVEAIKTGSAKKLDALIKSGRINLNARYDYGDTILHIAAEYSKSPETTPKIIEILVNAGADIEAKNNSKKTPLHEAAGHENVVAVKALLENGANPNANALDVEPRKEIKETTKKGFWRSLYEFMRPPKQEAQKQGKSPLYLAQKLAQKNDTPSKETREIIEILEPLTDKASWFVVTPEVELDRAIYSKNASEIKNLLATHKFGQFTLNYALLAASRLFNTPAEIFTLLIDAGANVNYTSLMFKDKPLEEAISRGNLEGVKILLARGANPNALNDNKKTPLEFAENIITPIEKMPEIIEVLERVTKQSGDSTERDLNKKLVQFYKAIDAVKTSIVEQLVNENKFSQKVLNAGLIEAAKGYKPERAEIIEILLNAGADINATGYAKRTPLHRAVYFNNPKVVELLLQRQANPNALDDENKSPLYLAQEDIAQSPQTKEIIKLLEPVTNPSLTFKLTDEEAFMRAVKHSDINKIRCALELEQELDDEEPTEETPAQEHGPETSTQVKDFTHGSEEQLNEALDRVTAKKSIYAILGISPKTPKAQVKEVYRNWIRKHHPDLYKDENLKIKATKIIQDLHGKFKALKDVVPQEAPQEEEPTQQLEN